MTENFASITQNPCIFYSYSPMDYDICIIGVRDDIVMRVHKYCNLF